MRPQNCGVASWADLFRWMVTSAFSPQNSLKKSRIRGLRPECVEFVADVHCLSPSMHFVSLTGSLRARRLTPVPHPDCVYRGGAGLWDGGTARAPCALLVLSKDKDKQKPCHGLGVHEAGRPQWCSMWKERGNSVLGKLCKPEKNE